MIRINLLPVRQIKKRQQLFRQAIAFGASLLILFAGMGLAALTLSQKTASLNSQLAALNAKKTSFEKIKAEIEQLKKDREVLEKKLEAIKGLKDGSQQPVRILDAIADLTPGSRMWLKSLQLSQDKLAIEGVALDNATIAQYMKDLEAAPFFTSAGLGSTQLTQVGGKKLKSFTLALPLRNAEPVEPKEQPKGKKK